MPIRRPPPLASETTVQISFLLRPEQVAWIKAHGGRSASQFMRRLLDRLIEQERQEVRRLLEKRRQRHGERPRSTPPAG